MIVPTSKTWYTMQNSKAVTIKSTSVAPKTSKKRYYSHKESFRNEASKNKTTLSAHIWDQNLAPEPRIKWSILQHATSYRKGSRYCDLCLTEKLYIMKNFNNTSYLNKRSELAQRCRHRHKHLLKHCN